MTLSTTLTTNTLFVVSISNFKNPGTAVKINSTFTQTSSTGTVKSTLSAIPVVFKADRLLSANIQSSSLLIGSQFNTLKVSFTPKNLLKTTGKVNVFLPMYNYMDHQISSNTPKCLSVSGMNTAMTCAYNNVTQILTVSNPVAADSSNVMLSFTVDNFRNPYNGIPKINYNIFTVDALNNAIDSDNNFYSLNVTAT